MFFPDMLWYDMVIYGPCFSYTLSLFFPLHLTSLCPRQGWRGRCRSTWRNRWSRCVSGRCQSPQPRWRRRWWKCPRLRRSLTQHSIAIYGMIYEWSIESIWLFLSAGLSIIIYLFVIICLSIYLLDPTLQTSSTFPWSTDHVLGPGSLGPGPLLRRWLRWCERLLWWRCRMWRNSWRESKSSALGDPGRSWENGARTTCVLILGRNSCIILYR